MDTTTTNMRHAAVWHAAGLPVSICKQPCSPRCEYATTDTPDARRLIEQYERNAILDIPHRQLQQALHALVGASKSLQAGRIGGV